MIAGVVGWVPLVDPAVESTLADLKRHAKLRGLRHIVHDEPDDWFLQREDFNQGVARLLPHGLVYDILIFAKHLPHAIPFVDRHPQQPFVVDHIAKPVIRGAKFDADWAVSLRALAERPHVSCKLSGIVTEVRDPVVDAGAHPALHRRRARGVRPRATDVRQRLARVPAAGRLSRLDCRRAGRRRPALGERAGRDPGRHGLPRLRAVPGLTESLDVRQIVLEEPGRFAARDVAAPEPGAGEVLVRVRRVGICGTDLHAYAGRQPFFSYPRVLGHELAVTVERVPAGETRVQPGDLCTVRPFLNDPTSRASERGRPNCCERLRVLGVHIDGGMGDWLAIEPRFLHPVPDLDLESAALIEPLSIGCHAVARARLTPEDRTLVIGAGPIGLGAARFRRSGRRAAHDRRPLRDPPGARLAPPARCHRRRCGRGRRRVRLRLRRDRPCRVDDDGVRPRRVRGPPRVRRASRATRSRSTTPSCIGAR